MTKTFPILKIDNLLLRQIVDQDLRAIYGGLSNTTVTKYYGVSYNNLADTNKQMKWFKELEETDTGVWWAINDLAHETFYGAIGLNNISKTHRKAEIGFWLLPNYWGKGLMKKAMISSVIMALINCNSIG